LWNFDCRIFELLIVFEFSRGVRAILQTSLSFKKMVNFWINQEWHWTHPFIFSPVSKSNLNFFCILGFYFILLNFPLQHKKDIKNLINILHHKFNYADFLWWKRNVEKFMNFLILWLVKLLDFSIKIILLNWFPKSQKLEDFHVRFETFLNKSFQNYVTKFKIKFSWQNAK
jgi:hypothetical protein